MSAVSEDVMRAEQIVVDDERPLERAADSKYLTVRTTEFYGLDCEQWLTLVIKVGRRAC